MLATAAQPETIAPSEPRSTIRYEAPVSQMVTDLSPKLDHDPNRSYVGSRTRSLLGVKIIGCGAYLPDSVVTNEQLQRERGFDPTWIIERTGIQSRRHAPEGEATSHMAVAAARRAIAAAKVDPKDIDLLVVGTFTPDYLCPSTACLVQHELGLDCPALDLQAACSGFMYSLVTGSQFVATGNSRLALVIGADCNSRIVNPQDRKIAPLFGDGAGAVLVERGEATQGLLCYQLGSDGGGGPMLQCTSGGTRHNNTPDDIANGDHYLKMDGPNVFKWAVRVVDESIELVLKKAGLKAEDVSLFVLHQANRRIIGSAMHKLGVPDEKVLVNIDRYGNTSAGSIPICLEEATRAGRIKSGDVILMCGFGAGLTWGTALFRW